MTLPTHVYVGLAVTSHNTSTAATASFSNVAVSGGSATATATASPAARSVTTAAGEASLASDASRSGSAVQSGAASATRNEALQATDYDADGKSDLATFAPATGEWAILLSGGNYTQNLTGTLGSTGDVLVPETMTATGELMSPSIDPHRAAGASEIELRLRGDRRFCVGRSR